MDQYDYDLFVIGGGSGGVRAARMSAAQGFKVAVAEDTHWGGTCVNVGCVPKKLFVYAAHYAHDFEDARAYGWEGPSPQFNWPVLRDNKTAEIERLNRIYLKLLDDAGATVINGRASITGPNQVQVNGDTYTAQRILIAVGGAPFVPEFPGSELAITSDDVFYLDQLPRSVVVVGGGYIAVEFACIFAGLGVKVDLMYRGELFLRGFDIDLRQRIASEMRKQGIGLHFNEDVASIEQQSGPNTRRVTAKSGTEYEVDQVFYATGRKPRTKDLWPSDLDIKTKGSGAIEVDTNFQTHVPSIFALGDVVGKMALTPVATAEAMALLRYWQTGEDANFDYDNIPSAVFTTPSLASVGLTEDTAKERDLSYQVFEADFKHLKHTLTGRDERVYMKLLVDTETNRVIGAHMMGPDSGEVIQSVAVAIKAGATKAVFDQTIGIHPTMAEELVTMRTPRSA